MKIKIQLIYQVYTPTKRLIFTDWFTEYQVLSECSKINNFPTSTLVVLVCLYVGRHPCRDVQKSEGAIRMLSSVTSLPYILRSGSLIEPGVHCLD